jgi:hypothetical protein
MAIHSLLCRPKGRSFLRGVRALILRHLLEAGFPSLAAESDSSVILSFRHLPMLSSSQAKCQFLAHVELIL